MSITYIVCDWDKHFENAKSRTVKTAAWFKCPNDLSSDGYCELTDDPEAAADLGVWRATLAVASRVHPRGTLVSSDGHPYTLQQLARMTRLPLSAFTHAWPRLCKLRWIMCLDENENEVHYEDTTGIPQGYFRASKYTLQEGKEGKEVQITEGASLPTESTTQQNAETTTKLSVPADPSVDPERGRFFLEELMRRAPHVCPRPSSGEKLYGAFYLVAKRLSREGTPADWALDEACRLESFAEATGGVAKNGTKYAVIFCRTVNRELDKWEEQRRPVKGETNLIGIVNEVLAK